MSDKGEDIDKDSSKEITLTIDKTTLVTLCQNLNTNLLVNIAAYKNVLTKLRDSEKDNTKVNDLDSNIKNLNDIEGSVSSFFKTVQQNLDVSQEKRIDPEMVIKDANRSGSSGFMQNVLTAEMLAIIASLSAALPLAVAGGAKRKISKRRRHKGRKSTKKSK